MRSLDAVPDRDVKPVSGKFPEDLPEVAKKPSHTVGIWHLQLDSAGKKVQHVYFLRQLSADEAHRKVRSQPLVPCSGNIALPHLLFVD